MREKERDLGEINRICSLNELKHQHATSMKLSLIPQAAEVALLLTEAQGEVLG